MRVSKCTASFWSPIGTADVDFWMDHGGIQEAMKIALAMASRIYDGRRCSLVSLSIQEYSSEVPNTDSVMHFPTST